MDAQTTNTDKPTASELRDATYAALDSKAVSEDARKLVDTLCEQITATELRLGRRRHRRLKKAAQLRTAVAGFVADLLRAQASGNGLVYRALRPENFTGEAVSYKTFIAVVDMLTEMGLVESWSGYQAWMPGFDEGGPQLPYMRHATRFRATQRLLDLCADHSVRPETVDEHFIAALPAKPLVLKASSTRNEYTYEKVRGRPWPFDPTPQTEKLEAEVKELNEFFDGFELRGGTHRGFIRVFNNGDDPEFRWNKGGRLYSQGRDNYQTMDRDDRLRMTINGEAVCEIDIRASYLTIFHAWRNQQLDPARDPYDLPGFGKDARDVVKMWFVAAFGSDGHPERWPRDFVKEYREETERTLGKGRNLGRDYPIKSITKEAMEVHPLLKDLGKRRNAWADLMWQESMAMIITMLDLKRKHSIPSLSVHDSLIVPISRGPLTATILKKRYHQVVRVEPKLVLRTAEGDQDVEDLGLVPQWIELEQLDSEDEFRNQEPEDHMAISISDWLEKQMEGRDDVWCEDEQSESQGQSNFDPEDPATW
jgi:hypothetical protein